MQQGVDTSNREDIIQLSRNYPVALVIGAAGFIGSHLSEELLELGIQLLLVDNLSTGKRTNLKSALDQKGCHLLNLSVCSEDFLKTIARVPRLDYVFFLAENRVDPLLYLTGLDNLFKVIHCNRDGGKNLRNEGPKIVFVSSIRVYLQEGEEETRWLKQAEVKYAKQIKAGGLNGRIVRLSEVFGPRMSIEGDGILARLIRLAVKGKLTQEESSAEFSARAIYVGDAVSLIIKSVLLGATSGKIFDGCLPVPVKVSEIKQVLLDPAWHENKHFQFTELPPWPTPNLAKSLKELSWKPETDLVRALQETLDFFTGFRGDETEVDEPKEGGAFKQRVSDKRSQSFFSEESVAREGEGRQLRKGFKFRFLPTLTTFLIIGALVFAPANFVYASYKLPENLGLARLNFEAGDIRSAQQHLLLAAFNVSQMEMLSGFFEAMGRLGIGQGFARDQSLLIDAQSAEVEGISRAVFSYSQSPENLNRPGQIRAGFDQAQRELSRAELKLTSIKNGWLVNKDAVLDRSKLDYFRAVAEKGSGVAVLWETVFVSPESRDYLVLVNDSFENGGQIIWLSRVSLGSGQPISAADIDLNGLDAKLQIPVITPIQASGSETTVSSLSYDGDFSSYSRRLIGLYRKATGRKVAGVLGIEQGSVGSVLGLTAADVKLNPGLASPLQNVAELLQKGGVGELKTLDKLLSRGRVKLFFTDQKLLNLASSLGWV